MNHARKVFLFGLLTIIITSLVGCGPQAIEQDQTSIYNGPEPGALEGNIIIDGSSTVFPIMEAITEEYSMFQPKVKVSVGVSGTGGGFKRFIAGETDINNASRPIKDEEREGLEAAGIEFSEIEIAYDGLSVAVNNDNDWVEYLTIDELKQMWIEDGTEKKWSDIRPEWPDEVISFYSPGTDSGTFDYFNEVILEDEPIVQSATLSEDDNILITGVSGDKNAIGYFGYAYYSENKDKLKVVPIVNPDTGEQVEPTNETIESGTYSPLSRALYIYVRNEALSKPEVFDFIRFAIENGGALAEDTGYVGLPKEKYDTLLQKLAELQ